MSSPSRVDPVVSALSPAAGGRVGRRLAHPAAFWTALPVLILFATASMAMAVLQKNHCVQRGWAIPDQFWHACYTDVPVLYLSSNLGRSGAMGFGQAVGPDGLGQPPIPSALMWLVAKLIPSGSATAEGAARADEARLYFEVSAVLLTVALLVAVIATVATIGRRRSWDGAHLALAPVLVTVSLISYELVAVAFVACAMWAFARSRPVLAGAFLALAIGSRPLTAMVLPAFVAVCLRAGRMQSWVRLAGSALAVWVLVRVVLSDSMFGDLSAAAQNWRDSGPGYGSLWLVPRLLAQSKPVSAGAWYGGDGIGSTTSSVITLTGLTLVAVGTVAIGLTTRYRPRVAHLALFALAASMLVAKSFPVQASLLLLPLLALSALPWRDHLIWATAEVVHFVAVWLYIAGSSTADRGMPAGLYLVIVLARVAATAWIAWRAFSLARDPVSDPVRVEPDDAAAPSEDDDPGGGVVDGAADALVLTRARERSS